MNFIRDFFARFFRIFFTPKCPVCGIYQDSNNICYGCFNQLEFLHDGCLKCQEAFEYPIPGVEICAKCQEAKLDFYSQMKCALRYNELTKNLVVRLKNHHDFGLVSLFANFVVSAIISIVPKNDKNALIVPVPLYRKRLVWRGYNQSLLLARGVGRLLNISVANALQRTKDTNSQAMKTIAQRYENVKGVFVVDPKYRHLIANKHIVLIDDVVTTGATVFECAKSLAKYKPAKITIVAIARRLKQPKIMTLQNQE